MLQSMGSQSWTLLDIWQNQYNIVKLKNKIKTKKTNVNFRNYFSSTQFPIPKDLLKSKAKKSDEVLKKRRWMGKEILN